MEYISGNFDKETGISTVVMKHLGVEFTGIARLHPDDVNNASEYAGCEYAEKRAVISALKYERKIVKQTAEECRKFLNSCQCYKSWDPESATAKAVYKQLNKRIKKVNDLTDRINDLMYSLDTDIWRRDRIINKFNKNKAKEINS